MSTSTFKRLQELPRQVRQFLMETFTLDELRMMNLKRYNYQETNKYADDKVSEEGDTTMQEVKESARRWGDDGYRWFEDNGQV